MCGADAKSQEQRAPLTAPLSDRPTFVVLALSKVQQFTSWTENEIQQGQLH